MAPNAVSCVLAQLETIFKLCCELATHPYCDMQIEDLADRILVETKCNYAELSRAFALTAESLVHKIIMILGKCIDVMFSVSIEKWNNVKVRTAFAAIDEMGPHLRQSWEQYLALQCSKQ
jgi:hypothetical protein